MNKKLLLSFAVFAAGFAVNAQKNVRSIQSTKFTKVNSAYVGKNVENDASYSSEINSVTFKKTTVSSKKRGAKTIIDTLKLVDYKKAYGNQSNFLTSSNNSGYKLKGYPAQSPETGTDYLSLLQNFNSKSEVKLKGVGVVLRSLNTTSADVNVYLYAKKTKGGASEFITTISKNIVFNAVANNGYTAHYFMLPSDVVIPDTFSIEIAPNADKDSIQVLTTGSYGRQTSATASISGTTLTATAFVNTGFSLGQEISGTGVTPGTKVTAQTGANTYTVSISQDVASTTITAPTLTYGYEGASLGVFNMPTSGQPSFNVYPLFWNAAANKPYEADVYAYPIVEFNWESNPTIDNKCLSTSKDVKITFSNEDLVKNPLFNRAAFDLNYRGKTKADNAFYSVAQFAKDKSVDAADQNTPFSVTKTYANDDSNDTILVTEYFITYNKLQSAYLNYFDTEFLVSGNLAAVNVTDAKCFGDKVNVDVAGVAGFAPVTGLVKVDVDAVAGEKSYNVSDANGCQVTVKATIKDAPAVVKAVASSVDASNDKTNDGKASVEVTGGTAPYTYEWSASAGTTAEVTVGKGDYTVVVKDANGCSADAAVTVKAGTASISALAISNLSVYPNPVKEFLTVKFDSKSIATVELVNVAGQVIDSKVSSDVTFNTSSLVAGVYFVNIKVAEGVFTQKLIKE